MKNSVIANSNISIEDNQVPISSTVTYLGFFPHQNLTFQREVKNVLRKMACGIETLNSIKNAFNINTRLIKMNALFLSHLDYTSFMLNSITENLVASLDQQLNSEMKSCFNPRKFNSSSDLKVEYPVLPIRYLVDFNLLCYFGGSQNSLSAFKTVSLPTFTLSENKRTGKLYCKVRHRTSILENCLIKRGCKSWNSCHAKHQDSTSN